MITAAGKRIGLMFGSFNPIHVGHLIVADTVLVKAELDEVWLVVSPQSPFKTKQSLLNEHSRLLLAQLATEDDPHIRPSDVEFRLPRPSYTVDTLAHLSAQYPQHDFALILGQDNLTHFHKWKNHEEILAHYRLLVYPRPGAQPISLQNPSIQLVNAPVMEISASEIRRRIAETGQARYFLPKAVHEEIQKAGWYR